MSAQLRWEWLPLTAAMLVGCSSSSKNGKHGDAAQVTASPAQNGAQGNGAASNANVPVATLANGAAPAPSSEAAAIALAASDAAADTAGADARYFSLSYLQANGFSAKDQVTVRKAVGKLMNSLSWAPTPTAPLAVDQDGLLLKIHLKDFGWTAATWEMATKAYPAVSTTISGETALVSLTGATKPVIRGEWFVSNASLAPLYYNLLDVPADFNKLQTKIKLDVAANVKAQEVIRAGFDNSVVSTNHRVIERHALGSGFFWRSYEFGTKTGNQNIFQVPLGPLRFFQNIRLGPLFGGGPLGNTTISANHMFQDDGGEIYFTLPNGLLAFYIADGTDQRIDKVPGAKDIIFAGYSCMGCHFHGPINKADMVAAAAASIRGLAQAEQDAINKIYVTPAAFSQQIQTDSAAYAATLAKLGIAPLDGDPISLVVRMNIDENL